MIRSSSTLIETGNARLLLININIEDLYFRDYYFSILDKATLASSQLKWANNLFHHYFFQNPKELESEGYKAQVWLARECVGHCSSEFLEDISEEFGTKIKSFDLGQGEAYEFVENISSTDFSIQNIVLRAQELYEAVETSMRQEDKIKEDLSSTWRLSLDGQNLKTFYQFYVERC